ncbi:RagB/SusD family nutrient uptake outer membrane protein [Sinomicrobium soli]|uniref:RagB/SusD family nutrient uptake outer membrane protein n=1 Tax=Sinomicrobium sp. N-1-3-6 TaxID=2219864 RepID=UPI001374DB95|nr:RagB/SusD family nutrient uptake outer membrane protein [Sinomicrobium sp. N-1-3-6]
MKTKLYCILLLLCTVFHSCSLDRDPEDFISTTHYYNTEEELSSALVGVYNVLGERFLFSAAGKSLVTDFDAADEMYLTNSNAVNSTAIYSYSATDENSNSVWGALYRGVERANLVLVNADKPDMDEDKREIIKGEAKFLRAFYHFILVQNFGDIPLRTEPTASVSDVFNERVPASEVYEFIYNEMVEAEGMVPEITAYDHAGRVTRSAVQGMLARVSLFMAGYPNNIEGKYEDALHWAEEVINGGYHELNPDYSQVFINLIQDKYDTRESIWEVEFFTTGSGEIYNNRGFLGIQNGILNRETSYGVANPAHRIHAFLYDKYNDADMRRDWAIAPYSYANNRAPDKNYAQEDAIYSRYIGKYRREFEQIQNPGNWNGTNFPLLRYADVLLMAAEAENEINGPTSKALDYINQVRRRAFADGKSVKDIVVTDGGSGYTNNSNISIEVQGSASYSAGQDTLSLQPVINGGAITDIRIVSRGTMYDAQPSVTITSDTGEGAQAEIVLASDSDMLVTAGSKEEFRRIIREERSRELAFEGCRRLDLIRWGILVEHMKELAEYVEQTAPNNFQHAAKAGNNVEEKHIYMPIPNWELSVNHNMTQNPGW